MSGYKSKSGMIDNRMVGGNHQRGIERVLQRRENRNDYEGHKGKMGAATEKADFARKGDSLTPRKA